ncbi:MAG: GNA1162 family protein [Candidatus Firestonebacteria bacterium]
MANILQKFKAVWEEVIILLVIGVFLGGCTMKWVPPPPRKPPLQVAVLPMENLSNDVNGPPVVREAFNKAIARNGYITLDLEIIDKVLKEDFGVTDGGQLRIVDDKELARKLGVNILIYGEVVQFFQGTSFEVIPFGLVYKREVKVHFKMVNVETEKVIWEKEHCLSQKDPLGEKKNKKGKKDKEEGNFFGDLLGNVVADTVKSGLEIITDKLVEKMANNMPSPYYY